MGATTARGVSPNTLRSSCEATTEHTRAATAARDRFVHGSTLPTRRTVAVGTTRPSGAVNRSIWWPNRRSVDSTNSVPRWDSSEWSTLRLTDFDGQCARTERDAAWHRLSAFHANAPRDACAVAASVIRNPPAPAGSTRPSAATDSSIVHISPHRHGSGGGTSRDVISTPAGPMNGRCRRPTKVPVTLSGLT